jgi:hypothetical protein
MDYFGQYCQGFSISTTVYPEHSPDLPPPIGSPIQSLGSSAHGFALKSARTMPTPLVAIRRV